MIDKRKNKKCGNYYRHKILSKTVTLLYIITETVQYHEKYNLRERIPHTHMQLILS